MGLKPREMVTAENVREHFPAPRTENPFAGDPWWAIQSVGLVTALQILRLIPAGGNQQRALKRLRASIDECLMAVARPAQETIDRRMAQTMAPHVPTPKNAVKAMMDLAEVGPDDVVVDLGCGDGRVVFEAAKRGAIARGIDIDPDLIGAARRAVLEGIVDNRQLVSFDCGDLSDVSLADATVVTCYLVSSAMSLLGERLRALRPGTKVVSFAFPVDGWEPTKMVEVDGARIFLWVV